MFSPTKITLIGAVLFALQQTHYLPLQKHHLMFIYTVFTVVNKVSLVRLCDLENMSSRCSDINGLFWFIKKRRTGL